MSRRSSLCLAILITLLIAFPLLARPPVVNETPQTCSDDDRAAFQEAAESGADSEELFAQFGHCADSSPQFRSPTEKVITVNNTVGSIFYEQMNGCGYHPQVGAAACDVEVKRRTGYGAFPGGSTEHVTFCFFCGGGWIPIPGSVHVTDAAFPPPPAPSWGFMAFAVPPANCPAGGTGVSFPVRATLSWAVPAGNPCTTNPVLVWGNQITFDARDDP